MKSKILISTYFQNQLLVAKNFYGRRIANGVVKISKAKKLIKNRMMFNVLLPLNIAMILIIIEITKIIAPGKYQKLKSVLL